MRCLGRTEQLHRCRRQAARLVCYNHRWQPILAISGTLTIVGLFAGLYQDLWKPLRNFGRSRVDSQLAKCTLPDIEREQILIEAKRLLGVVGPAGGAVAEVSASGSPSTPEWATAYEKIRLVLKVCPNNEQARDLEETYLLRVGRSDVVIKKLRARLLDERPTPNLYCRLGRVLLGENDLVTAKVMYRNALAIDPIYLPALGGLGYTLLMEGEPAAAAREFQKARRLYPRDVTIVTGLGLSLRDQGKNAEAEVAFREAVKLDPRLGAAAHNLGDLHSTNKDFSAAIPWLKRAVELDPRNGYSWGSLGVAYNGLGDFQHAEQAFRRSVEFAPAEGRHHMWLAFSYLHQNRVDEGVEAFCVGWDVDQDEAEQGLQLIAERVAELEAHGPAEQARTFRRALEILRQRADRQH